MHWRKLPEEEGRVFAAEAEAVRCMTRGQLEEDTK